MKNLLNKLSPHKYFLIILTIGLFFRLYHAKELFLYSHDQDLSSWFIKDVLIDKHIRLIGQETSVKGLFIGPLFYYLLIPFYLIFNLDPIGGVYLSVAIALATITSIYFLFTKIFNKTTALIASLIYSTNFAVVLTDKEVVPTTPVYLWTVWYLYALYLLTKKDKNALILVAILTGFIWHINLTLAILLLLVPISFVLTKSLPPKKTILSSIALALVLNAPFFAFEFRHGFQQIRALLSSFSNGSAQTLSYSQTFLRTLSLLSQNAQSFLWSNFINVPHIISLAVIALAIFVMIRIKKISLRFGILFVVWVVIYIVFFTLNKIILSEYYLNGASLIFLTTVALSISWLISANRFRGIGVTLLLILIAINSYRFFSITQNKSGYIQRKEIIQYIKQDSMDHNYPCVSISYITDLGYNLGYRYFIWLSNLHTIPPTNEAPVYSIVFPHSLVDSIDKSFGALGLILPDREKYNNIDLSSACAKENSNVTDSMFGFTK